MEPSINPFAALSLIVAPAAHMRERAAQARAALRQS